MAATRNRNTPGDYRSETQAAHQWFDRQLYAHSAQGAPSQTYLAGNGLIQGRMRGPGDALSHNPVEIESMLFGIRATDLTLAEPAAPVKPELKSIPSMDLFSRPAAMGVQSSFVDAARYVGSRPAYLN